MGARCSRRRIYPSSQLTARELFWTVGREIWRSRTSFADLRSPFVWLGKDPALLLVVDADAMRELELDLGGGGGALVKPGKKGVIINALTGVSGAPWLRQRSVITRCVLPLGLGGGRPVAIAEQLIVLPLQSKLRSLCDASSGDPPEVDLKGLLEPTFCNWIAELVLGQPTHDQAGKNGSVEEMATEFLGHWRRLRAPLNKKQEVADDAADRQAMDRLGALVDSARARADTNGKQESETCSLLDAMVKHCHADSEDALRPFELVPNCVSFLTAGFETTYSVALFTLLALGAPHHSELRRRVHAECIELMANSEKVQAHEKVLRELKAAATKGEPLPACLGLVKDNGGENGRDGGDVGASERPLLVRCIAETLRVTPPVLGLPRYAARDVTEAMDCPMLRQGQAVTGDVLSCNGVKDDWPLCWDPEKPWGERARSLQLASWGIGERHCPAGTAAILAAWTALRHLLSEFEFVTASEGHMVRTAYLNPTLNLEGPQLALVKRASASTVA